MVGPVTNSSAPAVFNQLALDDTNSASAANNTNGNSTLTSCRESCGGFAGKAMDALTSVFTTVWNVVTWPFRFVYNCICGTTTASGKTTLQNVADLKAAMLSDGATPAQVLRNFWKLTQVKAQDGDDAAQVAAEVKNAATELHNKGGHAVDHLKATIWNKSDRTSTDPNFGGNQMMNEAGSDFVQGAAKAAFLSVPSIAIEQSKSEIVAKMTNNPAEALRAFANLATMGPNVNLDTTTQDAQLSEAKQTQFFMLPEAHRNSILGRLGAQRHLFTADEAHRGHFADPQFGRAVNEYVNHAFPAA